MPLSLPLSRHTTSIVSGEEMFVQASVAAVFHSFSSVINKLCLQYGCIRQRNYAWLFRSSSDFNRFVLLHQDGVGVASFKCHPFHPFLYQNSYLFSIVTIQYHSSDDIHRTSRTSASVVHLQVRTIRISVDFESRIEIMGLYAYVSRFQFIRIAS